MIKNPSQHEKVLYMIALRNGAWCKASDLMQHKDLLVGWEASARVTELVKLYKPLGILDTKPDGKYRLVRFVKEWAWQNVPKLHKRTQQLIAQALREAGSDIELTCKKTELVYDQERNCMVHRVVEVPIE